MGRVADQDNIRTVVKSITVNRLVDISRLLPHKFLDTFICHHFIYFGRDFVEELPGLGQRLESLVYVWVTMDNANGSIVVLGF